jgi:hypothetical protein
VVVGLLGFFDQRMTPARIASATIWARSPVPSFRPMRDRWLFTVSADKLNASPISLFDCRDDRDDWLLDGSTSV